MAHNAVWRATREYNINKKHNSNSKFVTTQTRKLLRQKHANKSSSGSEGAVTACTVIRFDYGMTIKATYDNNNTNNNAYCDREQWYFGESRSPCSPYNHLLSVRQKL
ncbi:unnamed protein product [Ceratitis capitata]|uniref:(Mediterranean fruit fly) hypothetical protein n=1 Tax=Ceratitis capitata TaxID=7213 RepID=A0A811UGS1_CERCA|nr:unnamed protein product [Ceratitis capitata]